MRPVGALIAILIALVMVLAGCLQVPDSMDGSDDADTADDQQLQDGTNGAQETGEPPQGREGEDRDDGNGDDGGNGGNDDGNGNGNGDGNGDNGNETEGECHEHDPPEPAHPKDHRVQSSNELRCPGHYVILDEGSGATWNAPTWQPGDWWRYRMTVYTPAPMCAYEFKETVIQTDTHMGVPVYEIQIENFDCDGDPAGDPYTLNRTQDSFMKLTDSGFINHEYLFPLVDGKEWKFRNNAKNEDRQIVDATLAHQQNFFFDGGTNEAWRTIMTWSSLERTIWWGVDAQHMLREEIHSGGTLATRTNLIDHSGADDDGGFLPLPLP